ncbi:MAG: RagB/SusD family nutrient uptake outer membrane protein [Prevotella sp.]|nr:RagB/SusD family nutrient uptake outer membrane protein [Prevotella sp.]
MRNNIFSKTRASVKWVLPFFFLALLPFVASCDDWLDVRSENTSKEQDQFDVEKGFKTALTGVYMQLASTSIYGQNLTMTSIECLADLWYNSASFESQAPSKYYFSTHDYTYSGVQNTISSIYAGLYKTIAATNVLIKDIETNGNNITSKQLRDIIEGEAYAIRAYCHLDALRLFGQLPQGAMQTVKLPYSYTTSIAEMPTYYGFNEFVANLTADIQKAESLLKESDPIFDNTFAALDRPGNSVLDDFTYYRHSRLNYWAVRALHARMALYMGNTSEAHSIAMEIINAKGADGEALITLSGPTDLAQGFNGLPSECLFYLSKFDLNDYANTALLGGLTSASASNSTYFISLDQLNDLYQSIPGSTASHNRYNNWWNRNMRDNSNVTRPSLKKYWYDSNASTSSLASSEANTLMTKRQIIPMLRLSEMYLIAIETSTDLTEVQTLYDTYMTSCEYTLYTPFETLAEARAEMVNEYRREFFGEGQMFFTYKRLGASSMLWNTTPIKEADYIIPLPTTEYDPAITQK